MSLQALPPEVFELVAEWLAYEHPPTLLNLARVNKSLHAWCQPAIKSVFFHDIKFSIDSGKDVAKVVESLQKKLEDADSFRQVRRLILTMKQDSHVSRAEWEPPTFFALRRVGLVNTYSTQYSNLKANTFGLSFLSCKNISERAWKHIADLIKRLPALTDVIYRRSDKFPLSLLEVLRPGCRLHMHSFWMYPDLGVLDITSQDFTLITSPFLYSVDLYCGSYDSYDGGLGRLQEEGMLRVLGLAPSLKEVKLRRTRHRNPLAPSELERFALEGANSPEVRLASLKSLSLHDAGRSMLMKSTTLTEWRQYVDFAKLERLELRPAVHQAAIETLTEYAISDQGFKCLRSLELDISPHSPSRHTALFYESVTLLLTKLPPLSVLDLTGWHSRVSIERIAMRHGPRLRKLHLARFPGFWQNANEENILQLGRYCPLLEELSIPIQRSKGDSQEVALYRALGTLKSLKYLDLWLDVSPTALCREEDCLDVPPQEQLFPAIKSPTDPSFDEFDNEHTELYSGGFYKLRKGHIRDIMINSVVDIDLASAIFRVISCAKGQGAQPLEATKISVKGNGDTGSRLTDLVELFSSSWIIRRDTRERHRGEIIAEEVNHWIPEHTLQKRRAYLGPELDEIFQRIWPGEDGLHEKKDKRTIIKELVTGKWKKPAWHGEGRCGWWNECYSFPLHDV